MSDTRGSGDAPNRVWFSEHARLDLDSIAVAGLEQFSDAQARKYSEGLFRALTLLAVFPQMGMDQSQIKIGLRRHVHGGHAIYYRIDKTDVRILRILGPGQDPAREFFD